MREALEKGEKMTRDELCLNANYIALRAVVEAYCQGMLSYDEFRDFHVRISFEIDGNVETSELAKGSLFQELEYFIEGKLAEWSDFPEKITEGWVKNQLSDYLNLGVSTGSANNIMVIKELKILPGW